MVSTKEATEQYLCLICVKVFHGGEIDCKTAKGKARRAELQCNSFKVRKSREYIMQDTSSEMYTAQRNNAVDSVHSTAAV